jgi:DNA-binding IclR family transcriptional regulator
MTMLQQINSGSNGDTSYSVATTVLKAFTLLEFIATSQPVQPATMCKALGLTRANLHRLLFTLMTLGYIEKSSLGYQLSLKLYQLGSKVPIKEQLRESARPTMEELAHYTNENIYLSVLYHDMVISIEEVKSSHAVVLNPDVTYTYPINTCASGKVLLSAMSDKDRNQYLEHVTFSQKTPNTIVDREKFVEAIKQSAIDGYALEISEFSPHMNSMASPIYNAKGDVVATIAVSGPAMRLTKERLLQLSETLKKAAHTISEHVSFKTKTPF